MKRISRISYTVAYRIGGTDNFEWRKCLPVHTWREADEQKAALQRAGYVAHTYHTGQLDSIGLPDTYE